MGQVPRVEDVGTTGGEMSFDDLFNEHYERVLRALWLLTGDPFEAEDLAQEAFARLYEHRDRLSSERNVAGYAYRTALNVHRSRLRRVRIALRHRSAPSDPEDALGSAEDRDTLRRAIADLSHAEREALVAVEWLDLSAADAASLLGTSAGAIRTRVSRAKARLRERNDVEVRDDR